MDTTIIDAELITESALALSQKADGLSLSDAQQFFKAIFDKALTDYKAKYKLTAAQTDDEIVEEWLTLRAGKSPHTLKMYRTHINQFFTYWQQPLNELSPLAIAEYEEYLISLGYSANSVAVKVKVLKGLLSYCCDTGYTYNNPGKIHHAPGFSEAQSERVFDENENELAKFLNSIEAPKEKLLFKILATTGLRANEAINLKYSDEIKNHPRLFKVLGKGNKIRNIYVSKDLYNELKALQSKDSEFLFASTEGKKMSYQQLYKLCKKYAKKAGINKHISLHFFRHYFANSLRKNGVDIFEISKLLGHAAITTTQRYFHSDKGDYSELIKLN